MQFLVFSPAPDLLAGRVLETVRDAARPASPRLVDDPADLPVPDGAGADGSGTGRPDAGVGGDRPAPVVVLARGDTPGAVFDGLRAAGGPVLALRTPDGTVPGGVPRVDVDPGAPDPALDAVRAWVRAVADGADPGSVPGVSLGTAVGAAALGGLAGLLLGGLLGGEDAGLDAGFDTDWF